MDIVTWLVVGLVAGVLAGLLVGGYGVLVDMVNDLGPDSMDSSQVLRVETHEAPSKLSIPLACFQGK